MCLCYDQPSVPYMRDQVSKTTIEYCLKESGTIAPTTNIISMEITNIGAGEGLLSEICRVKPQYYSSVVASGKSLGPECMIVKCTPTQFNTRFVGRLFRLFQTEVAFYRHNVPLECGMSSAECYFASYDKRHARCCLIMEDLAPDKPPSQIDGASLPQAVAVARQLAHLHYTYRNKVRSSGAGKWVSLWDDPSFPLFGIASSELKKVTPNLASSKYM